MTRRPSYAQLEGLLEFLEQNPGVAKGLLRTAQGKLETKRKWAKLAPTLNSLGGVNKDGHGWAKYWAEKKHGLKKQCAQLSALMKRTGGGTTDNLPKLSALENKLVAVMGGKEFATGGPRLIVDASPQTTKPTESRTLIEDSCIAPVQEHKEKQNNPGTSHNDAIPASSTKPASLKPVQSTIPSRPHQRRSSVQKPLDANMDQFASIEARRVEAEITTAQAFAKLSDHIGKIATALTSIAIAISDVARKMPNP